LAEAAQVDRRLAQVARTLRRGDDDRDAAVGHQAAIEEMQRLDHPARRVVVVERHRLAQLRARVHLRPRPLADRDRPQLVVGRPVQVHVPAQRHRVPGVRRPVVAVGEAQAVEPRRVEAPPAVARLRDRAALAQRRVGVQARDDGRLAGGDRVRGVLEHRPGRRAERAHHVQQREVGEPERELQRRHHLRGLVAVDEQPVDLAGLESGVVKRLGKGVAGEVGRRAAVDLAHLGDAEPGDRGRGAHAFTIHAV
jgi:hypothetical protein